MEESLFEVLGAVDHVPTETEPKPQGGQAQASVGDQLRRHLVAIYGFRDKRVKNSALWEQPIPLEDRRPSDTYSGRWWISLTVPESDDGLSLLELSGIPFDEEVVRLIEKQGGKRDANDPDLFRVPVRPKDSPFIRKLARAVRRVVFRRNPDYPVADWRWLAGRTHDALLRFADRLSAFTPSAPRRDRPGRADHRRKPTGARHVEPA